jgi:membrane fusion protein (multidrug efflux system)
MFGRMQIDYDQRADALVLPRTALLDDESNPAVFAVRNGKAQRVAVKLGYVEGEWAEVRDGLKLGDRVVVAGKTALRDGSLVQEIGANASPGTAVAAAKPSSKHK